VLYAQIEGCQPVPCFLDLDLPLRQNMPITLPRIAEGLRSGLGGDPSGVPCLPNPVRYPRLPVTLRDPL